MGRISVWDIVCLVELVFNIIVIGLLANQYIFPQGGEKEHFIKNQFCYGATFGTILVLLPILFAIAVGEERQKKTILVIAGLGAVLFLVAGILMILEIIDKGDLIKKLNENKYNQLLAGASFALVLGVVFLVHVVAASTLILLHKEEDITIQ